jgi:transmembrane sensor
MAELMTKQLLDKYFEGECSLEEKKRVLAYLEQDDLSVLDEYILEKGAAGEPIRSTLQQSVHFFDQLRSAIEEPKEQSVTRWRFKTAYGIAASITLLVGIALIYWLSGRHNTSSTDDLVTISNHEQFTKKILLSDSTQVWLNPNSSIAYHKETFADTSREVSISGEAFFDVSHDAARPFKVQSGGIITRVLGTTFNVTAYKQEKDIQVLLIRGKIQVTSGRQQLILKPGQLLKYTHANGSMLVHEVDVENKMDSFTNGKMVFDNISLATALARISAAYSIKISVTDSALLQNRMISGAYTRASPNEVLRRLLFIHGLKFKKKGDNEYLIKN